MLKGSLHPDCEMRSICGDCPLSFDPRKEVHLCVPADTQSRGVPKTSRFRSYIVYRKKRPVLKHSALADAKCSSHRYLQATIIGEIRLQQSLYNLPMTTCSREV